MGLRLIFILEILNPSQSQETRNPNISKWLEAVENWNTREKEPLHMRQESYYIYYLGMGGKSPRIKAKPIISWVSIFMLYVSVIHRCLIKFHLKIYEGRKIIMENDFFVWLFYEKYLKFLNIIIIKINYKFIYF